MEMRDLRSGLLRRWYVVLLGVLATVALTVMTMDRVPATYQAGGSALLVPGRDAIVEGGNPFLYLGGLVQARDVLVRRLASEELFAPLTQRYPETEVSIRADPSTSSPVLLVTATAPTPEAALAARDFALEVVPVELDTLQDAVGAPEPTRAGVIVLTADAEAEAVTRQRTRALGGVVAGGIVGTVLLTALVDGLLLARRARRGGGGPVPHQRDDRAGRDEALLDA